MNQKTERTLIIGTRIVCVWMPLWLINTWQRQSHQGEQCTNQFGEPAGGLTARVQVLSRLLTRFVPLVNYLTFLGRSLLIGQREIRVAPTIKKSL